MFLCLLWQMRGKIRKCPELRRHFSIEGYVSHLTESPSNTACLHKSTCFVGPDIPGITSGSPFGMAVRATFEFCWCLNFIFSAETAAIQGRYENGKAHYRDPAISEFLCVTDTTQSDPAISTSLTLTGSTVASVCLTSRNLLMHGTWNMSNWIPGTFFSHILLWSSCFCTLCNLVTVRLLTS